MRTCLLTILAISFWMLTLKAQNYYISSSASSQGNGTIISPWNSFAPLHALLASSASIDTLFLKRGDVFRDQITVSLASNFVITAYGAGPMPIISGADPVQTWKFTGAYWEADFTKPVFNFFANDKEQIIARFPDENAPFLTVDGGSTNSVLKDAGLSAISTSVLNKSQVCVHTAQWCWEKSPIASSTSNSITYLHPTLRVPTANYGYFLYDHISYLTTAKEWKYDATAQKIYFLPSAGDPNNLLCEASVRPYGILLNPGVTNVKISHIAFEKQSESGIAILNSSNQNILIDSCHFARQYKYGIDQQGKYVEVANSYFREIDGLAIYLNGNCSNAEIHHNVFRNNGGFRNSGIGQEINLSSIKGAFVDSCHIHHNDIDSAGYCGISMDGRWNIIERNIVKNAMLLNNDGAALKSFGAASQYNIFRNNFISKSDGNTAGTPNGSFITPAIYFDFSTNNCTIQENTIYDQTKKGIFLNSGTYANSVIGNVVYGGKYLLDFNGSPIIPTPMTGMVVKKNTFFAKDPNAYIIRMVDNTGGYNHGLIDSNYYFQPYNENNYEFIPPSTSNNFTTWQSNSGYDVNTVNSFVSWTLPTSYDTLLLNPTDDVVTINLGTPEYSDLDNNIICGTISLQPYTSKILIKTSTFCYLTGISESTRNDVRVYPNPFSTQATLLVENPLKNATLIINNSFGQTVNVIENINGNTVVLNRDNLVTGLYIISLTEENNILYKGKIVITD